MLQGFLESAAQLGTLLLGLDALGNFLDKTHPQAGLLGHRFTGYQQPVDLAGRLQQTVLDGEGLPAGHRRLDCGAHVLAVIRVYAYLGTGVVLNLAVLHGIKAAQHGGERQLLRAQVVGPCAEVELALGKLHQLRRIIDVVGCHARGL